MDAAGVSILQETRLYVQGIFNTKLKPSFVFHNWAHTEGVAKACEEMADYYQLSGEDRLVLFLAAWFHDTGYSYGVAEKHEEASVGIARHFLQRTSLPAASIDRVASAIAATRLPQSPGNLIEEILCDADLFHLGTGDFKARTKLLRKEQNLLGPVHYSKEEWNELNKAFLLRHHYFTSFCRERLEPVKQLNLHELDKKIDKHGHGAKESAGDELQTGKDPREVYVSLNADGSPPVEGSSQVSPDLSTDASQNGNAMGPFSGPGSLTPFGPELPGIEELPNISAGKHEKRSANKNKKNDSEKSEKSDKAEKSERGITTTFRITSSNHSNLSHMADNKAHIMISVNSIIISIIISLLIRHLQDHHNLIIPTTILMIVSVVTMVFAILATRPNVSHGVFTADDVKNRRVNLLFFGNYFNMSVEEYGSAMKVMIDDRDYMYENIIKDIYYQGIVLARKYKYLRIAYTIFMYGIVVSVLAFSITMFFM